MLPIRRTKPSDLEAVTRLVGDAYRRYVPRIGREPAPMTVDYAAPIEQRRVWVAEQSDDLVGVLVLEVAADHLHVETLAVSPERQGCGIGTALLAFAEERCRAEDLHEIRLYTNESMIENLGYYARRGFIETHRATSDGFNRVHFSKTL